MPDLIIHPLAFGGVALEPLTDAAHELLYEWAAEPEADLFIAPDACMEGLPRGSVGFQPWEAEDYIAAALSRGLTVERAS